MLVQCIGPSGWGGFKLETTFEWGTTYTDRCLLVPISFLIYINDLEEGVTSNYCVSDHLKQRV